MKRIRQYIKTVSQAMEEWSQRLVVRWQTASLEPEAGMATAEYAVVLIAATGFAGLLVTILKSDAVRTLLLGLVKKALNIG